MQNITYITTVLSYKIQYHTILLDISYLAARMANIKTIELRETKIHINL